jgi:hypothetical protein
MVLVPQRPALERAFLAGWLGLAATAVLAQTLRWLAMSLAYGSLFPLAPLALETLLTVALYPIAAILLLPLARLTRGEDGAGAGEG